MKSCWSCLSQWKHLPTNSSLPLPFSLYHHHHLNHPEVYPGLLCPFMPISHSTVVSSGHPCSEPNAALDSAPITVIPPVNLPYWYNIVVKLRISFVAYEFNTSYVFIVFTSSDLTSLTWHRKTFESALVFLKDLVYSSLSDLQVSFPDLQALCPLVSHVTSRTSPSGDTAFSAERVCYFLVFLILKISEISFLYWKISIWSSDFTGSF